MKKGLLYIINPDHDKLDLLSPHVMNPLLSMNRLQTLPILLVLVCKLIAKAVRHFSSVSFQKNTTGSLICSKLPKIILIVCLQSVMASIRED